MYSPAFGPFSAAMTLSVHSVRRERRKPANATQYIFVASTTPARTPSQFSPAPLLGAAAPPPPPPPTPPPPPAPPPATRPSQFSPGTILGAATSKATVKPIFTSS